MSNKVLASAVGAQCCTGLQHTGEPAGHTEVIAGATTYISNPTNGKDPKGKILFFLSDIWGALSINNKLLEDYFASRGFLVFGIDYFEGDPIGNRLDEPGFDLLTWVEPHKERAVELVPGWIKAVKEKFGDENTKYSAAGYCFGAPFVLGLGAEKQILSGAIIHSAFLNEDHFRNNKVPILIAEPEDDPLFPRESLIRAQDILIEVKTPYYIQIFSGVSHGFAVRGDPDVENERWAKEESARSVVTWFERFAK